MLTSTVDIGLLITRSSEIRGGRPRIAGTGLTVRRIVGWYQLGLTPEEILNRIGHPTLTLAHVHAALAYYHANQSEIDADIAEEQQQSQESITE
jgi:uncharacterized protein (DUF433 family)